MMGVYPLKFKTYTRREILSLIKNAGLVVLGSIILAFGFAVFLVPYDLIIGGIDGIAIVLVQGFKLDFISFDVWVLILTWGLFFLGLIFLGKDFAFKTLISAIVFPPAQSIFLKIMHAEVFGDFFVIAESMDDVAGLIIAAVFGGVFVGAGCALAYLGGGSTGGTDIIALIMSKYIKRLKSSVAIFLGDTVVILLGIFVLKDLILCLLGITAAFVGALVIDKIFLGHSQAFIANIVSDKYEEINEAIIKKLDRTSTIITANGGFSGEKKRMIMVSFTMPQYAAFLAIIKSVDREAFVTVHRAHEINGEGWTKNDLDIEAAAKAAAEHQPVKLD